MEKYRLTFWRTLWFLALPAALLLFVPDFTGDLWILWQKFESFLHIGYFAERVGELSEFAPALFL